MTNALQRYIIPNAKAAYVDEVMMQCIFKDSVSVQVRIAYNKKDAIYQSLNLCDHTNDYQNCLLQR